MKKIMIDLDETIASGGFLALANLFMETDYKLDELEDYYVERFIPDEKLDEFWEFFYQHNVYDYVTVFEGAYEVIQALSLKNEVYICSAYQSWHQDDRVGILPYYKFQFLRKEFPFLTEENFIFINHKELLCCDIKIDDRLDNLIGYGDIKLLFNSYHNQDVTDEELEKNGVIRVFSWKDVANVLKDYM